MIAQHLTEIPLSHSVVVCLFLGVFVGDTSYTTYTEWITAVSEFMRTSLSVGALALSLYTAYVMSRARRSRETRSVLMGIGLALCLVLYWVNTVGAPATAEQQYLVLATLVSMLLWVSVKELIDDYRKLQHAPPFSTNKTRHHH